MSEFLTINPKKVVKKELEEVVVKEQERQSRAVMFNDDHLKKWATAGVIIMAALSAGLNGYANSQHATIYAAGWGMGIVIPMIVLIIGKVAGLLWRRGHLLVAKLMGLVGVGLLFLSVWHCANSIALLTGSGLLLSLPMAVAIDCGLVGCEVSALIADDHTLDDTH